MKNKNKIKEAMLGAQGKTTVVVPKKDLNQTIDTIKGKNVNIVTIDKPIMEIDAIIEPQDQATIKYLSNVIDNNTGEVSKPFVIGDKQYKMVRGIDNDQNIVMGVFCFDDMDGDGNNMIHPVDYFEENVVMPMMEKYGLKKPTLDEGNDYDYSAEEREYEARKELDDFANLNDVAGYEHFFADPTTGEVSAMFKTVPEMLASGVNIKDGNEYMNKKTLQHIRNGVLGIKEEKDSIGLSEYKHFIVNEKTGKFRKFKEIPEVAKAVVGEGERYMNLKEFKKFFEGKVFGGRKKPIMEVDPTPQNDEQFKKDVQNAVASIENLPIVQNRLKRVNSPIEKSQFMLSIAEMIGLDLKLFAQTVKNLRSVAKQQSQAPQQQTQQTAQPVTESKKVIKTIKVKDIK